MGRGKRLTEEDHATIREMWPTHTQEEIAANVGVSSAWVSVQGRALGLPDKRVRTVPHSEYDTIRDMWETCTLQKIGDTFGVSRERIRQIGESLKLPPKRAYQVKRALDATCPECRARKSHTAELCRKCFFVKRRSENTRGAQAYRLRCSGLSWRQVADALGCDSAWSVCSGAKAYCLSRNLQLPKMYVYRGVVCRSATAKRT